MCDFLDMNFKLFGLDKMSFYFCIINAEQSNPGYFYKTGLYDDDIGVNCVVMIMTESKCLE